MNKFIDKTLLDKYINLYKDVLNLYFLNNFLKNYYLIDKNFINNLNNNLNNDITELLIVETNNNLNKLYKLNYNKSHYELEKIINYIMINNNSRSILDKNKNNIFLEIK